MFEHRFDQVPSNRVALHWYILTFNGGCINAGGFLATGRFVSHVTGFATLVGVDVSKHQFQAALGLLSVPLFFLMGAFIAGLLIDRPISYAKKPRFDWVMGLSALCLFCAASANTLFEFGNFGEAGLKQNYILMVLLCLASGLQNGAITSSSGRSVRTTHLTGLTTDLGLGLARVFSFNVKKTIFQTEMRANYLRLLFILTFVGGSIIGASVFVILGYKGFILSGMIASYAAWHGRKVKGVARVLPSLN